MPILVATCEEAIENLKCERKQEWETFISRGEKDTAPIITNQIFENCDWTNFNLQNVYFEKCSFKSCKFNKSLLLGTNFTHCSMTDGCDFSQAVMGTYNNNINTTFSGYSGNGISYTNVLFTQIDVKKTEFRNITLAECLLTNSNFRECSFSNVFFYKSNLENTKFIFSEFKNHVIWESVSVNDKTDLIYPTFDPTYLFENDKSEKIKINPQCLPTWEHINFLSKIPIFQASFAIFLFSLFLGNVIVTLNSSEFLRAIEYPIPFPRQLTYVILSSTCLFIGAFFYKIGCPNEVQNFTASEWVIEHGKARPIYILKTIENPIRRRISIGFLAIGGILAFWLISCRVLDLFLGIHHNCLFCHAPMGLPS